MSRRARTIAFERGGLLGLAVLVLYVWLAPAHVVDGDNAELTTVGVLGGVAHPSGYPLFVLWLRATAWLPGSSPAHTASIATALLGAASIVMMHAACRAWGARPLAASLACAIFAGAPVVLATYTEAEVFALNGLVVATIVWLAGTSGPLTGRWRAGALGVVAGLGLSNHLTCALVAPIGILGVVRGVRESDLRAAALAGGGLVVGLTPYLYLLIAPASEASWGHPQTLGDVLAIFLRRDYGGPGAFAGLPEQVSVSDSLLALVATLGRTWWYLPAAAGLTIACVRVARPRGETRAAWTCWLASFAVAGPLLVTRFDVPPEGVGLYVVARFHILPAMLLAIPVAQALDALAARVSLLAVAAAVPIATFVATAGTALSHVLHVHAPAVEEQAVHTLQSLPQGAVVLGIDDDLAGGVWYAQLVLGVRRDIDYVHLPMFGLDWYRARLRARGFDPERLIDDAHAKGRPIFVQGSEFDILDRYPHYRYGILMRVLARDERVPSLAEVVEINQRVYKQLAFDYERPGGDDEWVTAIHDRYARTWLVLGQQLALAGDYDQARRAFDIARVFGPRR